MTTLALVFSGRLLSISIYRPWSRDRALIRAVRGSPAPSGGLMSRLWAALLLGLVASSSSSSIPNTDSCWARNDGICDDGVEGSGPWANACPSPCGTDLSDCGIRYEHECRLPPPPSPAPPPPSPVNYWEASPDENNSNGEGTTVIILIVVGVLVAIVAVAIVGCIVSLKCFAIFVLVLSIITLLITIVSVPASFFLALPAAAVSTVAFVLACIGSSIVVCGCCKDKDGNPGGHISCGVLCLLSFIFRLVALVVLLIFFLPLLYLSFLAGSYFGIIALALMTVLTVATGLAELVLGIRCIIWACAKGAQGAAAGAAGAAGSMMGQSDTAPQQVELVVGTAASSPAAVASVAVAVAVPVA